MSKQKLLDELESLELLLANLTKIIYELRKEIEEIA